MLVIYTMARYNDQIMSVRLWPLIGTCFDDGLLLFELEEFLCENPFKQREEELFIGVKKTIYYNSIRKEKK